MLKIGWCRLLRIAKDRLVQVKDRLVQVTLVDVSNVSFHRDFCAVLGTVLAHLGQARYPTWASTLPHLGTFAARMLPICPQYGRLRLGLNKILLVLVCDEPRVSVLPRMITHPNLPQGKGQVTLLCQRLQQINSANEHQPPPNLPRRGG